MDDAHVKQVIEALLFVFGQPVALKRFMDLLPDVEPVRLRAIIQTLNGEYTTSARAFRIQEVAGGYQLVTEPQFAP